MEVHLTSLSFLWSVRIGKWSFVTLRLVSKLFKDCFDNIQLHLIASTYIMDMTK